MEAASIPEQQPDRRPASPLAARRRQRQHPLGPARGRRCCTSSRQDPKQTLEDVKTGLSNGTIWALIALGYTLVYGIIELINFAHGEVFMIGSFVSRLDLGDARRRRRARPTVGDSILAILAGLAVAMLASGTLNVMIERVAYRPLRNAPEARAADHRDRHELHPAERRPAVAPDAGRVARPDRLAEGATSRSSTSAIVRSDVFAVIVTVPLLVALLWFVGQTRYGKAMRATAQDPDAARLMGINVDRTISLTFLLGGLLAGAAGMIYALYNGTIQFNQGFTAGLIAFTAAVMGGIGNLKGAVVGGLIIGVIQSISDTHYGQVWTPAVVFAILILVMVFRPQGLFGEETREG